jgi:hypothetical protein
MTKATSTACIRGNPVQPKPNPPVEDDNDLQHQGRAADDPDKCPRQPPERSEFSHRTERNDQPERHGADKRDDEYQECF